MASLFSSTKNTRELIPGSPRYIRSDAPDKLSPSEIQWLFGNEVTTVVDLRAPDEVEKRPCPLETDRRFKYLHMPVTGGDTMPKASSEVVPIYLNMVDGKMRAVLDALENAEANALYFCVSGKDRTGVVSAMLLLRMGAPRDVIVADYTASYENLKDCFGALLRTHPGVDPRVVRPVPEYMEAFLDGVAAGKTPEDLASGRKALRL